MARVQQIGFEINSTFAAVELNGFAGTPSLTTLNARLGVGRCMRVTSFTSATQLGAGIALYAAASAAVNGVGFWFRADTLPSADNTIFAFTNSVTSVGTVRMNLAITSGGQLKLRTGATTQLGSNSATLNAGWNLIEIVLNIGVGGSSEVLGAKLNGTVFATSSTLAGLSSIQSAWIGANLQLEAQTVGDWSFDDLAIDSAATYPNPGKIYTLFPAGAGDSTQWTKVGTAATNWQSVGENPPDDGTTFVESTTGAQVDLYKLTNPGLGSTDTVNFVAVNLRLNNNTATTLVGVEALLMKNTGGTQATGTQITPNSTVWRTNVANAAPNPTYPTLLRSTDPDGSAWTVGEINSTLQAGINLSLDSSTNFVQVSGLWATIDVTPGVALTNTGAGFFML